MYSTTKIVLVLVIAALVCSLPSASGSSHRLEAGETLQLKDGWLLRSSAQVKADGNTISTTAFEPKDWHRISIPCTVLGALVKNGVYPDPRIGLNNFRIPDASDEFNAKYDLAKYSHLPDKRNPWKEPYWFRCEFEVGRGGEAEHVWLNFDAINYRADVWLNGVQIADRNEMAGVFQRFRYDTTAGVKRGEKNCLAVKIYQLDKVGSPRTQLEVFGKEREYHTDVRRNVSFLAATGYDCMPPSRDRAIGIWQDVYIDITGGVDIRDPFVSSDLPLPKTDAAELSVSAKLVNATSSKQKGLLKGRIKENGITFEKEFVLDAGESRVVTVSPQECEQLVIKNPKLWWPNNYGPQNLYNMELTFECDGVVSDKQEVTFGIREVSRQLHEYEGAAGLRILVNGKKIFCRGGYIQQEIMFDWDAERMDAEIRYLTEANLNLVYFEDIVNPPAGFLETCDKYGLMFGMCFYGCCWRMPEDFDVDLLLRCTADTIKRYRNHPSLILYMAMNEGTTPEVVYRPWRKYVTRLDGTRLHIPSASFGHSRPRQEIPEWIMQDFPVGATDISTSYGWQEPSTYYNWVRKIRDWMFVMEVGSASVPPIDSVSRFIPDFGKGEMSDVYPLDSACAYHGANRYYKRYDRALRKMYGPVESAADYCLKGHLVTADQHRAMFEAVNHKMWDITSGLTQWKVNACWPSMQWQIYDWFLRPMVSLYYIKKSCAPLHVQLSPLDSTVTVVNNTLEAKKNLKVRARVYDFDVNMLWEREVAAQIDENCYKDIFQIPKFEDNKGVYFVKLELEDGQGRLAADNFYWLSPSTLAPGFGKLDTRIVDLTEDTGDFTDLHKLPLVKLDSSYEIEINGQRAVGWIKVVNPTDKLAFFVHAAITKGKYGEEVLPVFWSDNYFSLLPGESKELQADFSTRDLGGLEPVLEVGGWNILSDFECSDLRISETKTGVGDELTVTATITNTFIDGSKIPLYVDNKHVDSKLLWNRAGTQEKAIYTIKLNERGEHKIKVGNLIKSVCVH